MTHICQRCSELMPAEYDQGGTLRFYRRQKGFTQAELAQMLGKTVHQSHISEMERGVRVIGRMMARRIGAALAIDYRSLL